MNSVDVFERERPALTSLGYRMLGERAGAEDVVQETWIKWAAADHDKIDNPQAWLRRVASNIAIDALRSARARRVEYVGPWLPEPLMPMDDSSPAKGFELAQECELALLWAMEHLGEVERAAFIMREAFDASYEEISRAIGRTEAACRQIVSRAHRRLNERGPRFDADPSDVADLIQRFFSAVMEGDRISALNLLSPDAIAISDGGRKARAARRPLQGPGDIVQVLFSVFSRTGTDEKFSFEAALVNGMPALMRSQNNRVESLTTLAPDRHGNISWIYIMRNPDKLDRH